MTCDTVCPVALFPPLFSGALVFLVNVTQMTKSWCETDSKALDRKEYYQERRLKDLQLDLPWEVRWPRPRKKSLSYFRNICGINRNKVLLERVEMFELPRRIGTTVPNLGRLCY